MRRSRVSPTAPELVARDGYSCGLTTSGSVWCWGRNRDGQLGTASVPSAGGPEADDKIRSTVSFAPVVVEF